MEYENYDECDGKRGSPGIGVDLAVLICNLHQKCAEILFSVLIVKQMSKVMMIIRTCKICDHLARAKKKWRLSKVNGLRDVCSGYINSGLVEFESIINNRAWSNANVIH